MTAYLGILGALLTLLFWPLIAGAVFLSLLALWHGFILWFDNWANAGHEDRTPK